MEIVTLTTRYDPREDRLRLAVADGDGNRATLWLNRRLTAKLVPALLDGVRQRTETPNVAVEEAANVYAQLQARLNKQKAEEVIPDSSMPAWLVQSINLKSIPGKGRRITLRGVNAEQEATLVLSGQEQRQWLEALRQACGLADWGLAVWPNWFQSS